MDGTATISLDTLDELREKAEEARLATNRSKKTAMSSIQRNTTKH